MKTYRAALRMSGLKDNLKYVFNAGYYDTYGASEPYTKMTSNPGLLPDFGITPVNNTTAGKLEQNAKYFNFSGDYNGLYVDMSYNRGIKEAPIIYPSYSTGTSATRGYTLISFGIDKKLSDTFSFNANVTYNISSDWYDIDWFYEGFYSAQYLESEEYRTKITAFFSPSDKVDITFGLDYRILTDIKNRLDFDSIDNNSNFGSDDSIITRGLFAQANFTPSKNIKFVVGGRLYQLKKYRLYGWVNTGETDSITSTSIYDQEKIEVIPRLALIWSVNKKNVLKFLYGKGINHPSFFQSMNQLISALPNLTPEFIETFELNYIATLSDRLTLNASAFYNTLNNLIVRKLTFDPSENIITQYYSNAGEMVTKGVELTLLAKPLEGLLTELSGVWQKTEDKREGFENRAVEYSPELLFYLKASYNIKKLSMALTGKYVDGMEPHWDVAIANPDGTYGGRIAQKVDGYFLLDANLRWDDFFAKGYYLNLRLSNLFDTAYLYPTYINNNTWANKGSIAPGRCIYLTIGKKF
ncbi:MAG: TonB-dependent receptor [bacterium]|nr:TonB-dependent receptor [bacterium]